MRVPLVLPHAAIVTPTEDTHKEANSGDCCFLWSHPPLWGHRGPLLLLLRCHPGPPPRGLLSSVTTTRLSWETVPGGRERHAHWLWQEGKTNLSHDGLNPAHVPCWWVNNPTL